MGKHDTDDRPRAELIVITGLTGSRKSWLAHCLVPAYRYIDFDFYWHHIYQDQGQGVDPFVNWLAEYLERNPATDYVIDGWYRWGAGWHNDPTDCTLHELASRVPHRVRVVYIGTQERDTLAGLASKGARVENVREKQVNLLGKIGGWVNG